MAVAIGDHTDAITLAKAVFHQPLEGAPGRMDLHRRFQARVVRVADIGRPATDMGIDDAVLIL